MIDKYLKKKFPIGQISLSNYISNRIFLLYIWSVILLIASIAPAKTVYADGPVSITLANGFKAILYPNPKSPVIASQVTVKVGSSSETAGINGVSHILEHMLFNGTAKRTQEMLYEEADFYGIYNNAHTSQDFTNYIVMSEKGNFQKALDLQSDMLFSSTINSDKLEKEKGIIKNEIAKDSQNPDFLAKRYFKEFFYKGTPYNLSVLGSIDSIMSVPQSEVKRFYKKYYVPNNMTALIMGGFALAPMIKMVNRYFGSIKPDTLPTAPQVVLRTSKTYTVYKSSQVKNSRISIGLPIPSIKSKDFYPLILSGMLLNENIKNRINNQLKKRGINKRIVGAYSAVDFNSSFATFQAEIQFEPSLSPDIVKDAFYAALNDFSKEKADQKIVNALLLSEMINEITLKEKPHYYAMMKGKYIAAGGIPFAFDFLKKLKKVKDMIPDTVKKYFTDSQLTVVAVLPEGVEYAGVVSTSTFPLYNKERKKEAELNINLIKEWNKGNRKIQRAPIKGAEEKKEDKKIDYDISKKLVLKNGLTLLINSNPFSTVFSVHVLVKNRSYMEPQGKAGIADFLHRLFLKGTSDMDEEQLKASLSSIGAKIKTHDAAFIPYDDYYTDPLFSFIRFSTIDKYAVDGAELLLKIITNPRFEEKQIEQVRREMTSIVESKKDNVDRISRKVLLKEIFKGLPQSGDVSGTVTSIKGITKKDLVAFYKDYFSPQNLIISVTTSKFPDEIVPSFKKEWEARKNIPNPLYGNDLKKNITQTGYRIIKTFEKGQSFVRAARLFPIKDGDRPLLRIMGSFLSGKLSGYIREKKGMSYSVGAGFRTYGQYALLSAYAQTTKDTVEEVGKAIVQTIKTFSKSLITKRELDRITNRSIFLSVMRRLTRDSQSYNRGLEEFLYNGADDFLKKVLLAKKITPEQVNEAIKKYFGKNAPLVQVIVE